MKKTLLIGAVFCLSSLLSCGQGSGANSSTGGQGIVFDEGTFQELLDKAKAENKLVFIDAYASWCGPCKRMASEVFPQPEVGEYFNATFINAKFDMEKGEGIQIARRYKVDRYPTFLLVDGQGVLKGRMIGGSPAADFIKRIKQLVLKADQQ
ncbi:MAG: thioredoxin family protein [Rikenellaceae bacterium]|jgi:thiol:disulfide interchange protein|nr:thioredoxin family protein [Rikenellaceae bacterium]